MGFNFKEKLEKVNKRNVLIFILVFLVAAICVLGGIEYYQYKEIKAQKEQPAYDDYPMDLRQEDEPKKPSEYNIGMPYDKAIKQDKPILTLFYADWCHYCIKFMPTYQEISEKYSDSLNFAKVNVEDTKYEKLVGSVGLTGYPTVVIIDPKYDNKVLISNAFLGSVEDLSKELDRYIRIRKILDSKKG